MRPSHSLLRVIEEFFGQFGRGDLHDAMPPNNRVYIRRRVNGVVADVTVHSRDTISYLMLADGQILVDGDLAYPVPESDLGSDEINDSDASPPEDVASVARDRLSRIVFPANASMPFRRYDGIINDRYVLAEPYEWLYGEPEGYSGSHEDMNEEASGSGDDDDDGEDVDD